MTLTFVTGIVDAVCFLGLGQVFAAMQTGNAIFLGLGIAGTDGVDVVAPLIALAAFVAGGGGAVLLARAGAMPRPSRLAASTAVEVLFLGVAAAIAAIADPPGEPTRYVLLGMLSLAMGVRNTVARQVGGPNLVTTVLNLTLTPIASPVGLAPSDELAERGAAFAAILLGAVSGALLLKASLALAIATAAAIALVAALMPARSTSQGLSR